MMKFDANLPIYVQIMELFKKQIVNGTYEKGDKIPPVRELAVYFGVNPNTVQRALSELEREGLLYSERTSGRYITQEDGQITALKNAYANSLIDACLHDLRDLKLSEQEIMKMIEGRIQHE